ncbi:MAG: prepilin-type N-terminal cleavage/methylation domain-containing protein [Lysobacteraceae bacterium]|nr:MAG: prepilin-type N-terminal cleavage/methylation domain-containing protein [Xanthomonadaceae bacterium]
MNRDAAISYARRRHAALDRGAHAIEHDGASTQRTCPMHASRIPRGFTLVELLMVLAIVAVLSTLAAPAFGSFIGRTQARTARNVLETSLNQARIAAVNHGGHVVVCPSLDAEHCARTTTWHQGWILYVDLDHDRVRADHEPLLAVGQVHASGVAIVSSSGRVVLDYRPDGSAAGTNLTLTICDRRSGASGASTVVVSPSGRVRRGVATPAAARACLDAAATTEA